MAKVHYEFDSRLKDVVAATHLPPSRNGQREHDKRVSNSDRFISDMNKLKQISFPHGSFFFGANSHQVKIPKSQVFDPSLSWLPLQRKLLDDSDINVEVEKKRCASYNFGFPNATMPLRRRRLFYGSLISGDSAEVIKATSMEQYNIFHTVSLIESNTTQNLVPKKWRFFGSEDASKKLSWLYQLFGPKTQVSVDYYVTTQTKDKIGGHAIIMESFQREGHVYRWKSNGMRPDDVAIIGDLDETFSRDFLRALQICEVPQFRSGQDCKAPKVIASTVVFESSPECTWKGRRWFHPDAVLGECVDQIGDTKLHPPTKRNKWESHGVRLNGYGNYGNYSRYEADVLKPLNMTGQYPLWLPDEIRIEVGGALFQKEDEWKSPTGYHFHNFFMSGEEVRYKYLTYGHPDGKAFEKPLRDLHGDLLLAVTCAEGNHTEKAERSFESLPGTSKPIYYLNQEARRARHSIWQDIVRKDAENATRNEVKAKVDPTPATDGKQQQQHKSLTSSKSHWDSSKSAVLGLASGYPRYVYEGFVGSLRATGFAGHIILAIAKDAPVDVVSYLGEQNVTMKYVEKAEKCTYNGTIGEKGVPIDMQKSSEWKCPKDYPDYKITWARFLYYRDWLNDCPSCTDGVMLTDVRDAFFQRDPFVTAVERNQVHPLMVFEETSELDNEHWLTDWPVSACRKHKLGKSPMLCSGSVMGSREGILDYIDVMEEEFKYWMERENCRIDNRGDDQSIHNYLYYTNRFKNAVSIPHRQGPIHVVGYQAARIFENATKEAENAGVGTSEIFIHDNNWKEWLPRKYGLINTNTGLIVNEDGTPSAQVHQVDRFGPLISKWENEMRKQGWPYNKDTDKESIGSSA